MSNEYDVLRAVNFTELINEFATAKAQKNRLKKVKTLILFFLVWTAFHDNVGILMNFSMVSFFNSVFTVRHHSGYIIYPL